MKQPVKRQFSTKPVGENENRLHFHVKKAVVNRIALQNGDMFTHVHDAKPAVHDLPHCADGISIAASEGRGPNRTGSV